MSEMDTSAEMMEVAEPSEDLSEESQEVASPESEEATTETADNSEDEQEVEESSGKTDSDTAFAEMRRARERAEAEAESYRQQLAEIQAQNDLYSELAGDEDWQISALAEATGESEEVIRLRLENEQLKASNAKRDEIAIQREADLAMQEDLATLQKIDPTLKSLADLGEGFANYINNGLDAEDAYWAIKAKENANKPKAPKAVAGAIKSGEVERDYYTEAEIKSMSSEERTKNYKKILASWDRNRKR